MMEIGYLSLTIMLLRALYFTQNHQKLSTLLTNRTRDYKGLLLGLIKPDYKIFLTITQSHSFW